MDTSTFWKLVLWTKESPTTTTLFFFFYCVLLSILFLLGPVFCLSAVGTPEGGLVEDGSEDLGSDLFDFMFVLVLDSAASSLI